MDINEIYQAFLKFPRISTDTRNIVKDSIFFALKGTNFNGNDFVEESLTKGAKFAVIDENHAYIKGKTFLVEDVLEALQALSSKHRNEFDFPVIAITGSNGKTTTKELILSVLLQGFNAYATRGNLNNHIGVPLTLLEVPKNTDVLIVEMGANHPLEIEALCKIAKPTHGLITNIGKAHLEGFGGFEGVKKAKGELYDYLKINNGKIYIQSGNSILVNLLGDYTNFTSYQVIGDKPAENNLYSDRNADFEGYLIDSNPFLKLEWTSKKNQILHNLETHLAGSYNLENVLAAITIGKDLNLSDEQIKTGIENYKPSNHRSQIIKTENDNHLICDYYNANASSMMAALENFSRINAEEKVLILGDMFELGEESEKEHENVLNKIIEVGAQKVFLIGKNFATHKNKFTGYLFFENLEEAVLCINEKKLSKSWILIKGSRGITLEKITPYL